MIVSRLSPIADVVFQDLTPVLQDHKGKIMNQHLRAIYEDGVFRPLEPVHIKEHQEVTLVLETTESRHGNEAASLPIWEFAAKLARDVPAEEWSTLPSDGAAELDHYLYGTSRNR